MFVTFAVLERSQQSSWEKLEAPLNISDMSNADDTVQSEISWLKLVVPANMREKSVTAAVFHMERGWSKATLFSNMNDMSVTAPVFHKDMSWSNVDGICSVKDAANIPRMLVTIPVSHKERSLLKQLDLNIKLMSVTADVSQFEMSELKAVGESMKKEPSNILCMFLTDPVFQIDMSPLKPKPKLLDRALFTGGMGVKKQPFKENIRSIEVTMDTFQLRRFPVKPVAHSNILLMSTTLDTSQLSMS